MNDALIQLTFKPNFIHQLNRMDPKITANILRKIDFFKQVSNHPALKVHKLHGPLSDYWSFAASYRYRIIFLWENESAAVLLAVGDHNMYKI